MDKIELVIKIGNEICEGCGPDRDCDLEFDECSRIQNAIEFVNNFLKTP